MKAFYRIIAVLLILLTLFVNIPVVSSAALLGDINGDGQVNSEDARLVLKFSSKMKKPSSAQKTASDMDGDGQITLYDVVALLKMANSIEYYEQSLLDAGFPASYVEYLTELHEKYPQWEFVPFITNLDWEASVKGERTPHSQQLIENVVSAEYKCSCSKCHGVIMEYPNWVSASETAVAYYMDPRNFLKEEYIFQFESTAFNESHTIEGVEAILKNTWMYKSEITYLNGNGNEKTYKDDGVAVTYSEAIMKAARDHGISAYFLASKIVQEVGSSSASYAGGSSGVNAPFYGIYNYYNIGAYTGVRDGLEWANGYMSVERSVSMYKSASTTSDVLVKIPSGSEIYYIGAKGEFYKIRAIVSGTNYIGYIKKENAKLYTSYGRPWTNPYLSIYNGAKYIVDSFSTYQFTGYLQKFNVNPASDSLYDHEYMANVRAAASEANSKYKAYKAAGVLGQKKVFSIPVFRNMPFADVTSEGRFAASKPAASCKSYTTGSVTLSWEAVEGAEKYQIYKYDYTEKEYKRIKTVDALTYKDSSFSPSQKAKYKIRAYKHDSKGELIYTAFSSIVYAASAPAVPSDLTVSSKTDTSVSLSWSGVECTGYEVYRYNYATGKYYLSGTASKNKFTDSSARSGTSYKYKIRAYYTFNDIKFYSEYSQAVSVKTTGEANGEIGYVTADLLNVRSSASTSAASLVQIPEGHPVIILDASGVWYKVETEYNGTKYTGFVHSDYIAVDNGSAEEKEPCPYAEPTVTIRQGDSGDVVKWLQWHLYKTGYLTNSDVDGSFGPGTLGAVIAFQEAEGLDADGIVGALTREKLKSVYLEG